MRLSVKVPDPFHVFLSGGAGVGKSYLINAIYEGVTRALRTPAHSPDQPTNFELHEICEIVRQKNDPIYANILSRIRIGNIIDEDMKLLKDLENTNTDNFQDSSVKIFLTNKQVATFNDEKMDQLPERITIRAKDSKRDTTTNTVLITIMEENIYIKREAYSHH
ncbi:hypothetical protein KUTeg_021832 [Tegillarca granosa]|uniref:Uncharacterized protein n=1 Tax=Tegillarca granosa TaxID=220873 RepID=A0ABQ9EAN3_TEGGR|nr:hypothetical protein KUTeg_021832 [Tegillarca granosa]